MTLIVAVKQMQHGRSQRFILSTIMITRTGGQPVAYNRKTIWRYKCCPAQLATHRKSQPIPKHSFDSVQDQLLPPISSGTLNI